ncbi:methylated-DNA-[]-cysteine S-methyltransferase family protein [Rickettsia felis str. Pedreira]|uniref:methylated-DNA--[protein]-cysteine S-methyltransferase n=2 Tax=Rickettsia felis TaxID=42862 RepID=A0A0F3MTT1_RICFI|nr:methylated-DNA--[protein]-cysteine S-methyltransferase [Rickettsia felis]AAY61767.1 Methylated-DNA--protein-cysteine methyltransferase [Rickettsia felis URRWXCal2]KHO02739.1 cysteine methyltransferase [Rickettsia felis str. LSU]KHO03518.1 cysteine methyltransferase [Rickettsia felis]KJV59135.1 methylated-DNA-[]-cysteine S-methyltransferase family protein [Rickettsia felis str. Pedreira]MDE8611309.1 methylated-DNA--[protein]-cysteine S-methyltransferase [Rickettsia felis]
MSLKSAWLDTPLGSMLVISDEERLYLLDFAESKGLEHKIKRLKAKTKSAITEDRTKPILSIEEELKLYFNGTLQKFNTSIYLLGSEFQKLVWQELMNVPYGETRSYFTQAKLIGRERSYRAVANANGANKFAIIIPCHRIINNNGELGGYGSGLDRKKWLIEHEKQNY